MWGHRDMGGHGDVGLKCGVRTTDYRDKVTCGGDAGRWVLGPGACVVGSQEL